MTENCPGRYITVLVRKTAQAATENCPGRYITVLVSHAGEEVIITKQPAAVTGM
jgi:hypothetical protein